MFNRFDGLRFASAPSTAANAPMPVGASPLSYKALSMKASDQKENTGMKLAAQWRAKNAK